MMKDRSGNKTKFIGVFSKDELPDKLNENENLIINLDDHDGNGTHWTCIYNDDGEYCQYFDSYGFPPPDLAINFMRTSNKKIAYSTSQIQMSNSILCGYYCMYFINERDKGKSMYDIIYSFEQIYNNSKTENPEIIYNYFNLK